jgi:hypothetical protein
MLQLMIFLFPLKDVQDNEANIKENLKLFLAGGRQIYEVTRIQQCPIHCLLRGRRRTSELSNTPGKAQ